MKGSGKSVRIRTAESSQTIRWCGERPVVTRRRISLAMWFSRQSQRGQ